MSLKKQQNYSQGYTLSREHLNHLCASHFPAENSKTNELDAADLESKWINILDEFTEQNRDDQDIASKWDLFAECAKKGNNDNEHHFVDYSQIE
jgi:hypothetical protein